MLDTKIINLVETEVEGLNLLEASQQITAASVRLIGYLAQRAEEVGKTDAYLDAVIKSIEDIRKILK